MLKVFGGLLIGFGALAAPVQRSGGPEALRQFEALFGPRVPDFYLFEASRFYAVFVQFGADGQIVELAIEPKYFFDDTYPAWEEPNNFEFLSVDEYERLLSRLDQLRPRGPLEQAHQGLVFVTNLTSVMTDRYQNATVEWGELTDARRPEDAPRRVRWSRVRFNSNAPRQTMARADVVTTGTRVFGPRVQPPAFFEFGPRYVVRVDVGARGLVEAVAVRPKYFFGDTHPAWRSDSQDTLQPLSAAEYRTALDRVNSLRPMGAEGSLQAAGSAASKDLHETDYQHARLTWVDARGLKRAAPGSVFWFTVRWK